MATTTTILWDVDGTLLTGGQQGRLAFADAVEEVTGRPVPPERLPRMAGKTDRQIAGEILTGFGIDDIDTQLPAIEAALVTALLRRRPLLRAEGRVHPGVHEAIAALHAAGAVQTLVTGNLAANARTKLAVLGLLPEDSALRLDVGAYGDDHHDRDCLVPIALDRCRAAGFEIDEASTWVVGDTPRDLACARAAGVKCLLVGTGGYPYEEVAVLGADAAVPDLQDTGRIVNLLT